MKKHGWAIAAVAIAGVVIAGYFISQAVAAAPQKSRSEWIKGTPETIGKVVAQVAQPVGGGVGMKNTINIPPCAFVPDGTGTNNIGNPDIGCVFGSTETGNTSVAPVIFPKNAKRILHVDFYARDVDSSTWSVYFRMFDSSPWTLGSRTPIIAHISSYSGISIYSYTCTPSTKTILPDHVYYISVWVSDTGYLYGAIVYYSTVL